MGVESAGAVPGFHRTRDVAATRAGRRRAHARGRRIRSPAAASVVPALGLPGTLLQRMEALFTPVTWRRFGDAPVPAQFQLLRSTTGWAASERDWVGRGSWRPEAEGRRAGTSLRHGDLPEDAFPAGVLMRELRGPGLRLHPLRAVTPYLGDAVRRKRWRSLLPLSEPLCRAYGEPLTDFLNAAAALRDALTWRATPDPLNPPDEERVGQMKDGERCSHISSRRAAAASRSKTASCARPTHPGH